MKIYNYIFLNMVTTICPLTSLFSAFSASLCELLTPYLKMYGLPPRALAAKVALNHIGLLVVDEIQHVVNHKNGKTLVDCLTQLINNSGISIAMVP